MPEERVSETEGGSKEITQFEEHRKKINWNKIEHGLSDLWDNIKWPIVCVIRVLEGGKREDQSGKKGMEKTVLEILWKHKLTDPGNLANPTAG